MSVIEKKSKKIKENNEIISIIQKKIFFFQDLIEKTILYVQKNKLLDIVGFNDVNNCFDILFGLNNKIKELNNEYNHKKNNETTINQLQIINNELSTLFKNYGTEVLDDLLTICFGNSKICLSNENEILKFELLKKYLHPTSYKVINISDCVTEDKIYYTHNDNNIIDKFKNLDCFDVIGNYKHFHMKVYGIKVYLYNHTYTKCILIYGFMEDVVIDFLNNDFIISKNIEITKNISKNDNYQDEIFENFKSSLILKDYLIYDCNEIYNKYIGYLSQINLLKQKPLAQIIKEFMSSDTFFKRLILIQLLIKSNHHDNQYLSYLLYDLLSNDGNEKLDTTEQIIIFDSFPWKIKKYFRQAMKKTIQYTNELNHFDINKVPLEQQICLMNASDSVKEKAMLKMKEIKGKSEDSGSKARMYLDGLLKIPFGIYKHEPILNIMNEIKIQFKKMYKQYLIDKKIEDGKENFTSIEIIKYIEKIEMSLPKNESISEVYIDKIKTFFLHHKKEDLILNIHKINNLIKIRKIQMNKINYASKKNDILKQEISNFIDICLQNKDYETINILIENEEINYSFNKSLLRKEIIEVKDNLHKITKYISDVRNTLDKAVHGHTNAKTQIEIIIGQWINGSQDGYCFGFEGPPGVGKTSLAKRGISNCLKDENGVSRPFAMIQMGGDCNGSTLHGHNYTYIGSTWGNIVQILIDKKCMNPIIFIDEVDKISKTEHGKEIVGILMHLLDSTQNDSFQDKYFTGIDLDLSKALFILSYNDPESIDRILLDRIHRIKFENLTIEDKLVISNEHILPDIYKKMGLEGVVSFEDDVIKYVIEEYTSESGVRKLKELLFQIVGEINIDILKNTSKYSVFPIQISIDEIRNKYFKDRREVKHLKIAKESQVGVINALYATTTGNSGILMATAKFFPSDKFLDLRLTGLLDDMMKESFQISLTLAWNLTSSNIQRGIVEKYNGEQKFGIHLHMGDGSIHKSGTSAGIAITLLFYSLFNNRKIKNNFAVTGEAADLNGKVGEIGALNYKFLGGIKANVKHFIFPCENNEDYTKFIEKHSNTDMIKDIHFHPVNHIREAIELIIEPGEE